jgi:transposase
VWITWKATNDNSRHGYCWSCFLGHDGRKRHWNAEGFIIFLDECASDWCYQRSVEYPILLYNNARPHKSRIVREFLEEKNSTLLPHPSYSPDMRPCDFNCFVHLKERLRGHRYQDFDQFNIAIKNVILELNQRGTLNSVTKLPKVWQQVINKGWNY